MLIKFTGGGRGGGGSVTAYLERSEGRDIAPEVVRGNLEQTRELIDATERKWTYTHGVLSFAPEDDPSEEQQHEAMDRFEELAFAGLERDQYDITWVRHTEHNRVELHFVTPRTELSSGKALNIAPPGWQSTYEPLRDYLNHKHNWARPDDPERARELQGGVERLQDGLRLKGDREAIHGYLTSLIARGDIQDRPQMVAVLNAEGLDVTRQGKNYITVYDRDSGSKIRMKGRIYEEGWTYAAELKRENASPAERDRGQEREHLERIARELEKRIADRARSHNERYPRAAAELENSLEARVMDYDIVSGDRGSSFSPSMGWDVVETARTVGIDGRNQGAGADLGRDPGQDRGNRDHKGHERGVRNSPGEDRHAMVGMRRPETAMLEAEGLSHEQTDGIGARIAELRASLAGWFERGSRAVSRLAQLLRSGHEQAADRNREASGQTGRSAEGSLQAVERDVGSIRQSITGLRTHTEGLERDGAKIRTLGQERGYDRGGPGLGR